MNPVDGENPGTVVSGCLHPPGPPAFPPVPPLEWGACALLVLLLCASPAQAGLLARARRLVHDGYGHRARVLIRPHLAPGPADGTLLRLDAEALFLDHHFQRAYRDAKILVREKPQDAKDWLFYAGALLARSAKGGAFSLLGNAKRMHRALERAVRLDPRDLGARFSLLEYDSEAPGFLGGSTREARAELQAIERENPAYGQMAEAELAWGKGHRSVAVSQLRRVVAGKQVPHAAPLLLARYALAIAVRDRKKKRTAIRVKTAFRMAWTATRPLAIRNRPRRLIDFYRLGLIAALSGFQRQEGIRFLRVYLAGKPPDPDPPKAWADYRLGEIEAALGHAGAARGEYRDALADAGRMPPFRKPKRLILRVRRALKNLPRPPVPPSGPDPSPPEPAPNAP